MLRSFTISGFRNFGTERQEVGPLSRVNIFIGTNNSGKSNILRYIRRVVAESMLPGRSKGIALEGIDKPIRHQAVNSIEIGLPFDQAGKHANWPPGWVGFLRDAGVVDPGEEVIRFDVTCSHAEQKSIYSGPVPQLNSRSVRVLADMESTIAGVQHGNSEASFRNLMGRLFSQYQTRLDVHYIPSFRQINTRLDEFAEEYSRAGSDEHLIDGLAKLSAPRYNEQEKKLDFEKLRAFVGEVIDDAEVQIEIPADRSTINVKSGATFLPIESLGSGIHEVVMLAAEIILKKNSTILLEEPEVHLHPTLQKRLMNFIIKETDSQFFITTHAASVIDTKGASIFGVAAGETPKVAPLLTSQDRYLACHELGFRSSDLLQANCILWVEGPSDRIYLKSWLGEKAPQLVEGLHFTIMFYGGKLLSRLSLEDESFADYIALLPINRHPAILIDSDKASGTALLRDTKLRIISELETLDGFSWVTCGREIESYYSYSDRHDAVLNAHPNAGARVGGNSRYEKPISFKAGNPPKERSADKIAVANYLTANCSVSSRFEQFDKKLDGLIHYIERANS